jgi:hypothetical protein
MIDQEMTDQETDLACLEEEADELRPMRLRYGVTAHEATRHEPLAVTLSQEEPDLAVEDDSPWDEVDVDAPAPARTKLSALPDDLDEQRVSVAAESGALHEC